MIAALLCPGPSLLRSCPPDKGLELFDVVVAVNRAILLRPSFEQLVHWHACGDWDTLRAIRRAPKTGVVTTRDSARVTREWDDKSGCPIYRHVVWEEWENLPIAPSYSTVAGLAIIAKLGITEVMVFGDDKRGLEDWDGAGAKNRSDDRWAREVMVQDRAIAKLGLTAHYPEKRTCPPM